MTYGQLGFGVASAPGERRMTGLCEMPRVRRLKPELELATDHIGSGEMRGADALRRSSSNLAAFTRAIIEIEQAKGLPVHPESPTMH
jgi:hypothetical protein